MSKDTLHSIRQKKQQIMILQQQVADCEARLKSKTDGDLTMKEVIDRVKNELNQHYTPVINSLKEEISCKDYYY